MSRFETAFERIAELIREPSGNPAASAVLVAAAAVALALIVVMVFFFVLPKSARRRVATPKKDPRRTIAVWTMIVILTLAAVFTAYAVTGTNRFCVQACHADHLDLLGEEAGAHAGARCTACHENPPLLGVLPALVSRGEMAFWQFGGEPTPRGASVPSDRCERCHSDVLEDITDDRERGIRVSHAEASEAGMACGDCHVSVAHTPDASTTGMAPCALCHDGVVAQATCETCHIKDPSAAARKKRVFPKVRTPLRLDCDACHD